MNKTLTLLCLLICLLANQTAAQPEFIGPMPQLGIADPPSPIGAVAYRLSPGTDSLILTWLQRGTMGIQLRWVRLDAEGWGEPATITEQPRMMANWADVPAVVEGGDGALYAHWLYPSENSPEWYDIRMLRSTDDGSTWTALGTLNDDGVEAEHGFVSYVPDAQGVRAYWLDGRATREEIAEGVNGPMSLRTARIGETIEPSTLIDDRVCDCCATGAAITDAGPIVIYRDRSEADVRDISLAGGGIPGTRLLHADGWSIFGCPVNGPAIDAKGRTVAVAWYTAADNKAKVLAAISTNNGVTFGEPIVIDETRGASIPLGRVDIVLDGEEAVVSWLANKRLKGTLKLQRISAAGLVGEAVAVSPMDTGRLSGFPELEVLHGRAVIVWRDPEAEVLLAAAIPLETIGTTK